MFKRSDLAKLELILKYIRDIQIIVEKHGTVENTLSDTEGEYAIMISILFILENEKRYTNHGSNINTIK